MLHPPWLAVAALETGVRTFPAGTSNPRVTEYHDCTNLPGYDDKASWCSSFVNWSLAQVGVQGTGSALARSWLSWGEPLEVPRFGCIAVLSREDPAGWKGHVGFFMHADEAHVHLLGGNQLDEVRLHAYPVSHVLAYRWPVNGNMHGFCNKE
ncbi:MAG: hypothetical protein JWQ88_2395 [Rhodoferax sp.]|nr:hypothetical protein [Rhodoferax sp.]